MTTNAKKDSHKIKNCRKYNNNVIRLRYKLIFIACYCAVCTPPEFKFEFLMSRIFPSVSVMTSGGSQLAAAGDAAGTLR